MFTAAVVVSVLLAAALAWSAIRKLSHQSGVVRTYARVGVPEDKLNYLALVLLAGSAGLLLGLVWAPIGIAAAIGLVCYFVIAIAAHVRAADTENLPTPLALTVVSALALTLRLATM